MSSEGVVFSFGSLFPKDHYPSSVEDLTNLPFPK